MILLTKEREAAGLSQRQLALKANVAATDICKAETRGLHLYEPQLQRIAETLGFKEDPQQLMRTANDD